MQSTFIEIEKKSADFDSVKDEVVNSFGHKETVKIMEKWEETKSEAITADGFEIGIDILSKVYDLGGNVIVLSIVGLAGAIWYREYSEKMTT